MERTKRVGKSLVVSVMTKVVMLMGERCENAFLMTIVYLYILGKILRYTGYPVLVTRFDYGHCHHFTLGCDIGLHDR